MTTPRPTKLMIATPTYGGAQGRYVSAVVEFMAVAEREGLGCVYATLSHNPSINRARNAMAAGFLDSDCTHLLFLDDDIGFDPAQLIDLVRRAEADERIAMMGIPYARREIDWMKVSGAARATGGEAAPEALEQAGQSYPLEPLVPDQPFKLDEPVEVSRIGGAVMLIRRDVLEVLADRHKELRYVLPEGGALRSDGTKELTAFFHPMIDPETRHLLGDDYAFCHRARAAGFRIFVGPWMRTTHTGPATFTANLYDLAKLQAATGKAG